MVLFFFSLPHPVIRSNKFRLDVDMVGIASKATAYKQSGNINNNGEKKKKKRTIRIRQLMI